MTPPKSKLQKLLAEQDKHMNAVRTTAESIDAEIATRVGGGERLSDIARECELPRQKVWERLDRHKKRAAAEV